MSIQTQNQLVTVNESNESGGSEQIADYIADVNQQVIPNFKTNKEVTDWVRDNVISIMPQIRADYQTIHAEWQRIDNMISMEMEEDAKYKGETQVYLPTFVKALETRVAHISKASFPSDSYMDAIALKRETDQESAHREATKAWMKRQIETNAKLRSNLKPFARNVCAYGVGMLKVWWEDSLVKQKKRHKSANPKLDAMLTSNTKRCGKAKIKTVNNYALYAHPLTVDSLDQCTLVFEDIQISKQFVETMIKLGYWNREDITMASNANDTEDKRQMSLIKFTETSQTAVTGGLGGELGAYVEMSECWFNMHLPNAFFSKDEIESGENLEPVAMKAIICGGNIVDIQYNPFNHGKHPYLMKKLMDIPDVLITPGYGKMVMTSQYLVNDLVNQVNDNGIYGLNPVVMRDLSKLAEHSLKQTVHPGAVFDTNDKGAIEFDRPPIEQIQAGTALLQVAISQVNDPISPPILQGSGSGGGGAANTATGAQLLQSNTKVDIQDFNEDMEQQVFVPLMEMIQALGQQFETAEMFLAITGQQKAVFTPDMLAVEVSWQWVASSQTINQQIRGQQLGVFLQTILNPTVLQMLQMKGINLNIVPILRKMWEDGLGQRSFESIAEKAQILSAQPQPGMPQAPTTTQQPPTETPLSPEQVSTVSQNPNPNQPPVAPTTGEGEQFRSVRNEAEQASGLMGILGNLPKQ